MNDATFSGKNTAYRITVRQLESLIRLSEAMARVYCSKLISADHVKEAQRLLSNSIVKIEKSDIEIEMNAEAMEHKMDIENKTEEDNIVVNICFIMNSLFQQQQIIVEEQRRKQQQKITLSYEEYEKMAR